MPPPTLVIKTLKGPESRPDLTSEDGERNPETGLIIIKPWPETRKVRGPGGPSRTSYRRERS